MFNMQEAFDKSTRGIISQGGPAIGPDRAPNGRPCEVMCLYRAPNGRKCAAGWLIPDEYAGSIQEGAPAAHVLITLGVISLDDPILDNGFLGALQNAHDGPAVHPQFWGPWRRALTSLAAEFALNPAVLAEIPLDA